MRAVAVVPGDRVVKVVDHPEPRIERDTDVILEILEVGVCGTDREIARLDYGTPPPGSRWLVIGHESLARGAVVGAAVTRLRPGDLVGTMVRRPCGRPECQACARARWVPCVPGRR